MTLLLFCFIKILVGQPFKISDSRLTRRQKFPARSALYLLTNSTTNMQAEVGSYDAFFFQDFAF